MGTHRTTPGLGQLPLFDPSDDLTRLQAATLALDVLYDRASPATLEALEEDTRVERKPASYLKSAALADYFSMWANTGPDGGLIAVGISDDGDPLGCAETEIAHLNKLDQEARAQCPDAKVECKRVECLRRDGTPDFIVLYRVRFHPKKVVFTRRNEAFIRHGESKHKLTHDEITELQNEKGEVSIEQELCPQYSFPDDFDEVLVQDFAETVRANLAEPIGVDDIFANRHLGRLKDGKLIPNAACVLVFAKDPRLAFSGAKIHLRRFDGVVAGVGKDWNAVKDEFVEGAIPRLLHGAATFLRGQLRNVSALANDGRFYTQPEYPPDVWYEAIVNALVHRSYGSQKAMAITVKMFDDKLEVESPGGFPIGVTADNIYDTTSHPRNQIIMETMWFLRVVKSAAEGTKRMRKLMEEALLPIPEFRQNEGEYSVVRVVLRNDIRHRTATVESAQAIAVIGSDVYRSLDEAQRSVMDHAAAYGTVNTSQAVRITGRGWKTAHKILMDLVGRGLLRHEHKGTGHDTRAHFALNVAPPRRRKDSADG
jgi:ATP-dependent DNA helicase RecG